MQYSLVQYRLFTAATLAILLIVSQGCTKLAFPDKNDHLKIDHPSSLNGTYNNSPVALDSSNKNNTLWAVFERKAGSFQFSPEFNQSPMSVKLMALGEKRISALLYLGTAPFGEILLKGKMDGQGSFRLKQHRHNRGVPFIYMKLAFYAVRLRKGTGGELLVDVVDSHGKMIFILSGGITEEYTFAYSHD